jgi:hypothetical protein
VARSTLPPTTAVTAPATTAPATTAPTTPLPLTTSSSPTFTSTTTVPAAPSSPAERAILMVDAVNLPPGATEVSSLEGSNFSEPWTHEACSPLVDQVRFWTVPGAPQAVFTYISNRAPSWIPNQSSANPGPQSSEDYYGVEGEATAPGWTDESPPYDENELVVTIASTGNGSTGIRADGLAVPATGECSSSGGGSGNPSVG